MDRLGSSFARARPQSRAGGFPHATPFELFVAGPLQAIDEENHLRRGGIDEADVRRIQATAGHGANGDAGVGAVARPIHGGLVGCRVLLSFVPNAGHAIAGEPLVIGFVQADHRAALGPHEILGAHPTVQPFRAA